MQPAVRIVVAAPPEHLRAAGESGFAVAHMIYRVGRGYHLFRALGTGFVRGGMMAVDAGGYSGGPSSALAYEIIAECERREFSGVVLIAGDGQPASALFPLASRLARDASERGMKVFVPESLAESDERCVVLLPTALSGGTLEGHIGDALERYGHGRVALEIERVRMDFALPAETGAGKTLTAGELKSLMSRHQPRTFFSRELCTYYFTYRGRDGAHFVLYDNLSSILSKLAEAARAGIEHAFLCYPQVSDILDELRRHLA